MTYYQCTWNTMYYPRSLLMLYSLRHIAPESKFVHALHLDVFEHIIPAALIWDVLTETEKLGNARTGPQYGDCHRHHHCRGPAFLLVDPARLAEDRARTALHPVGIPVCACLGPVRSANGVSSWVCGPCVACSSVSATHAPPLRRRGPLPSACG